MRLEGRFELVSVVNAASGPVLLAQDLQTGRNVLVRFLEHSAAGLTGTTGIVIATSGSGLPVLITEDTPAWRDWRPSAQAAVAKPAEAPASEFTRMFDSPAPQPAAAPPSSSAAGDFTRFFNQPMAANPDALATPPHPVEEPPAGKPFAEAGEFTRFFVGTNQPQPSTAATPEATRIFANAAPAVPAETSEYTQFLKAAPAPAATVNPPATPLPEALPALKSSPPAWLIGVFVVAVFAVVLALLLLFAR